ncbi:hypothetical protein A9R01_01740 ['Osedax' symbiont bacterium Rs2_46_30_T18]|nr:hypothetical protein A9R01_01740 ['Osedax' symbiont bacterium Rs2_46_30_T18]
MSIKALNTLTVIAKCGSFASAAKALHLSQAAISIQIKNLEQELGCSLFDRSARSPVLNNNGHKIIARASTILDLYQSLSDDLNKSSDFAGVFTIGATRTAQQLLPSVIQQLIREHPKLQIKVIAGMTFALAEKVENGEIDAALIADINVRQAAHCQWNPYDSEPYFIVAPKHLNIDNQIELLKLPFIRFDKGTYAGSVIDAQLLRQGIRVSEVMQLDSLEPALDMVSHDLGVTVIPCRSNQIESLQQKFLLLPFGDPPLNRQMGLYQKINNPRKKIAALVLERIRSDT